jgi:tetratricopeptide (TPR) repeat protein
MINTNQLFQKALQQHQAGDAGAAAELYRKVLVQDPRHLDAINNLGVLHSLHGDWDDAVACYRRVLELVPDNLNALINLTVSLKEVGDIDGAADTLEKAAAIAPGEAELVKNLGILRSAQGRRDDARAHFERALELNDRDPDLHTKLGVLLREDGRTGDAADAFEHALALDPEHVEAHFNIGALRHSEGELKEAGEHYRRALRQQPDHIDICNNLGVVLQEMRRFDEAALCFREALKHRPEFTDARFNLGTVLTELESFDEAIELFDEVIREIPDHIGAYLNLGNALTATGELDRAADCYRRALEIKPDSAIAHNNLGLVHQYAHRFDDAEECFDKAIELDPQYLTARFDQALFLLLQGRLAEGWDAYEWRWRVIESLPEEVPLPVWTGAPLEGRGILVLGEQGPGDMVMFAQCLPDLMADAGPLTLTVEPRLVELFSRSFPEITVKGWQYNIPAEKPDDAELAVAIGSLPRFFRRDEESFGRGRERYLVPDAAAVVRWRERFAALGGGLKVGISWRGGAAPCEKRFRRMRLADWAPLGALEGAHFVNLQYGDCTAEVAEIEGQSGLRLADWDDADPVTRFDDFAAQVEALDLVVSVANTTIHVAGALGKPTLCLAPANPSYRWQLERSDCLWYPSVEILRQRPDEPWAVTMSRVTEAVASWIGDRAPVGRAPVADVARAASG